MKVNGQSEEINEKWAEIENLIKDLYSSRIILIRFLFVYFWVALDLDRCST